MFKSCGFWCLALALLPSAASANDQCLSAAETDLERLYCEVFSKGGGAGLPSQPDFNRNDPQVQALLLKRPAARLGLTVPAPGKTAPPQPTPVDKASTAASPASSHPGKESSERVAEPEPGVTQNLSGCELNGEQIRCPRGHYQLAENRPLSAIAEDALGPDNQLSFPSFEGNRSDETVVRPYLSDAYDQYIPKMLRIGLGANTMSFTAFHNAFHTLEGGGVDFAERMARTYELLKQDRRTLGVKTRYHDELPTNLTLCNTINRDVIVCDNVGTNWVFVRDPG